MTTRCRAVYPAERWQEGGGEVRGDGGGGTGCLCIYLFRRTATSTHNSGFSVEAKDGGRTGFRVIRRDGTGKG